MLRFQRNMALFLIFSGLLTMALPASAGLDFLTPSKLTETIKKQIAKQKINVSADLFNIDIYDGISAAAKYKLEAEPSYVAGYYTRLDQYTLTGEVNPGDILEDLGLPVGFGISKGTDIIFARQFKNQKDSLMSLPYTFKQFPINAERAINNLNVGDFVALQANLNLVLSVGASFVPTPFVNVGASTHILLSGQFLIHIFRMADNKVRLKFIAIRGKGLGATASAGIDRSFTIIGINMIDRYLNGRLAKIINFTPLALNADKNINDLFMLDYVFDLNNPQAAQAYNDIMTKKAQFKDLETTNPFVSKAGLEKKLMMDISDVENLFAEDKNKVSDERRVDRIFKGSNTSIGDTSSFKIGFNILRFEHGSTYSQNKVISYDKNENMQRFLLDTYAVNQTTKFFFGMFGDDSLVSSNLIFLANQDWSPKSFVALTAAREKKMKNVSRRDYRKIQERVRDLIPASEYAKIDWKNWDFSHGNLVNGYFKHEIFFHPEAVALIPVFSSNAAYQAFADYTKQFGYPRVQPRNTSFYGEENMTWEEKFDLDFRQIGQNFATAFNSAYKIQTRYTAFLKLKDYPIWQEHGVGFMLSLLPADQLSKIVNYNLIFSAKGADLISYQFGNFAQEELYKSLLYIQDIINNRSFDLRLYTDSKGEFSLVPSSSAAPLR